MIPPAASRKSLSGRACGIIRSAAATGFACPYQRWSEKHPFPHCHRRSRL